MEEPGFGKTFGFVFLARKKCIPLSSAAEGQPREGAAVHLLQNSVTIQEMG